jgi:hypothetical protein
MTMMVCVCAATLQACLKGTFGLDQFERAYLASAGDIYTFANLVKVRRASSFPGAAPSIQHRCMC